VPGFLSPVAPSPVHRLHPLLKILVASSLTIAALVLGRPAALMVVVAFFLGILVLSRIRPRIRTLLGIGLLLGLVALGNSWASADLQEAAKYSLRFAILVLGVPVCAATTSPQDLARALARWRLPGPVIISLFLAWRFFPLMREQVEEIRQANLLRGGRANPGWEWFRGVLLPFTFILMDYADRLSLALELRAFDPAAPRTWYRLPVMQGVDWGFLAGAAVVLALAVWVDLTGCPV
jgi:energy-coupling factor transport system permease protein